METHAPEMHEPAPESGGMFDGLFELIAAILKAIFSGGDDDEREAPTIAERIRAGKVLVDSGAVKTWKQYQDTHAAEAVRFQSPVEGDAHVSSGFGLRKAPKAGASTNHKGIDLTAPADKDMILAAADGVVLFADAQGKSGNTVVLGHADGRMTVYRHLSGKNTPQIGSEVAQGAVIGEMGNTGNSTGKHLHFEVRDKNGDAVNPVIDGACVTKGAVVAGVGMQDFSHLANRATLPKLAVAEVASSAPQTTLPAGKTRTALTF